MTMPVVLPGSAPAESDSLPTPSAPLAPVWSVGELCALLKRAVEEAFPLVRVRGEVSQAKRVASGHLYFRLKDEQAVLDAVCWRGVAARLAVRPEDGAEVICTGRLTTYPARSQYQLIVESVELAGEGALLKLLEDRRRRLAAEGLFDEARKQALPFLPAVIGVITSPTGAVIRDILHRLEDRFPRRVLLWPVAVQGAGAAEQVAAAIAGFNALPGGSDAAGAAIPRPDLVIVARGGGSLEDLMPFNEEIVVRAVAAGSIPLISAVGHETDTTLIDHAADRRAPTPTAAAEIAVPVRATLLADLLDRERRRVAAMARLLAEKRLRAEGLGRGLGEPGRLLDQALRRLDDWAERLDQGGRVLLERLRHRLAAPAGRLVAPAQRLDAAARQTEQLGARLDAAARLTLSRPAERLVAAGGTLSLSPCIRAVATGTAKLAEASARLDREIGRIAAVEAARLDGAVRLLDSYSYKGVLRRGYVVVRDRNGVPVTDPASLGPGAGLSLEFRDDQRVEAVVTAGATEPPGPRRPRSPTRRGGEDPPLPPRQGRLF